LARLEALRTDGPCADGFFINDPMPAPCS